MRRAPLVSVFVGTTDRLDTLERTVASYDHLTTPHELIIVDNGTEHPECLALLDRLERTKRVKRVYHLPACDNMDEVQANCNLAIRDQHNQGGAEWFAITEADVCFDETPPETLDVYIELAGGLGTAVGPHLRVDAGIPAHYPLRTRVLACETWMLYRGQMEWFGDVPYSRTQIDTTFHLFPRTRFFDRLHLDPVRVGPPYDAMHLDWYLNVFNPSRENLIYINGQRKVGSWGKEWIRHYWNWTQTEGPERALELLLREPISLRDLCNASFILSWAYQYGVGCEADLVASLDHLHSAIPYPNERYWSREGAWLRMVYHEDFGALGWEPREAVAA